MRGLLRREVPEPRPRWNRLRRATRIAPWGVTPQAARGDQCNLKPPLALPLPARAGGSHRPQTKFLAFS